MGNSLGKKNTRTLGSIFLRSQFTVAAIVLLFTVTFFALTNYFRQKEELRSHVNYTRDLFSLNLLPALQFNDSVEANKTLALLKTDPYISRAVVYKEGEVFASYFASEALILPTKDELLDVFNFNIFRQNYQIKDEDEIYGQFFIESRTDRLKIYLVDSLMSLLLGSLAAVGVSYLFSIFAARSFVEPIQTILAFIRKLSLDRDYSLNLPHSISDQPPAEIEVLYDNFRNMVSEIRLRDEYLKNSNELLESTVKERTQELRDAQSQMIDDARKSGIVDITTGILHNIANIMNTISTHSVVIGEHFKNSDIVSRYSQAQELLANNKGKLGQLLDETEKGGIYIDYFAELNRTLHGEYKDLRDSNDRVVDAANFIKEIINHQQALAMGRFQVESMVLEELVKKAVYIKQNFIDRCGVEVSFNFEAIPRIKGHRASLFQVFVNLISNSCQALSDVKGTDRRLRISAGCTEVEALLKFEDSGSGVPIEDQKKLFSQGFTTKVTGHGFGLNSCKRYMKEFGGDIYYEESKDLGGATFVLRIPMQANGTPE